MEVIKEKEGRNEGSGCCSVLGDSHAQTHTHKDKQLKDFCFGPAVLGSQTEPFLGEMIKAGWSREVEEGGGNKSSSAAKTTTEAKTRSKIRSSGEINVLKRTSLRTSGESTSRTV